jgi:transcriptional regulator with XRE-family HTH domain
MSQFSNQLQAAIESQDFTQTYVCDQTGISQGQLSRYVNGKNRSSPEALDQLCKIFDKDNQVKILLAYLEDDIPPRMKNLVRVEPKGAARVPEDPGICRTRMPRELRAAYDWLGRDAIANKYTADWIIANHRRWLGTNTKFSLKEHVA